MQFKIQAGNEIPAKLQTILLFPIILKETERSEGESGVEGKGNLMRPIKLKEPFTRFVFGYFIELVTDRQTHSPS